MITLGDPARRSSVSAFARHGERRYAFVHHDFPKTHDADHRPDQAYSRTVLYELVRK